MPLLTEHDGDAAALRRGSRRFLVFAALVTLVLLAAIVVRQGLFRQTTSYSFVADSAQDIAKGQAVRIAGFRVGAVAEVRLKDDGQVEVSMEIDAEDEYKAWRNAADPRAAIGADRLEAAGEVAFTRLIEGELTKPPVV